MRGRYEGMWNVVRFNWPKYAMGGAVGLLAISTSCLTSGSIQMPFVVLAVAACTALLAPLAVSHWIYDRSGLYALPWLERMRPGWPGTILNISAGFDETSALVREKCPDADLHALDFYDRTKHTEPSIQRARRAYPSFPGTRTINTAHLPYADRSVGLVLAFLSLHEVRSAEERVGFVKEIHRALAPDGQLIVTEHLRDAANFMAFNFGFLHFRSKTTWMNIFEQAGFSVSGEQRITPFITTFILRPQ